MFDYWSCWGFGVVAWEERPGRTSWGKKSRTHQVVFRHVPNCYNIFSNIFNITIIKEPSTAGRYQVPSENRGVFFRFPVGSNGGIVPQAAEALWFCEAKVFTSKRTKSSSLMDDLIEEDFRNMGMPQEPHLEGGSGSSGSSGSKWQVIFYKLIEKNDGKKYEKIPWHDETWWNMWVLLSIWVLLCVF